MTDLLFLLENARIRAFGKVGGASPQPLRYEGKEDMACAGESTIAEFLDYMLDNYGSGPSTRLSFVCLEADGMAACARAVTSRVSSPSFGLFTLSYLLPSFCRKLGFPAGCALSFGGSTWDIAGDHVEKGVAEGACPFTLGPGDVTRLFFAPEPQEAAAAGEKPATHVPTGELGRYVDGSRVQAKSSARGKGRG